MQKLKPRRWPAWMPGAQAILQLPKNPDAGRGFFCARLHAGMALIACNKSKSGLTVNSPGQRVSEINSQLIKCFLMPSLYAELLPILQSVNTEGGNFQAHLIQREILDEIDLASATDASFMAVRRKIREKCEPFRNPHDHGHFSQIVEAYSEGLILLAARERGLLIRAVPDGSNKGKTPDFETTVLPTVGFELKTLNVFDPNRTMEDVMLRGFEQSYKAEQAAKKSAASSTNGVGVGFGETVHSPHGNGATLFDAINQTTEKIKSNVKFGQYQARPTILVVSLARVGIGTSASHLKYKFTSKDGVSTGHLFAVAAGAIGSEVWGYGKFNFDGSEKLGILSRQGVLLDKPFVAGIAFVETSGQHYAALADYLRRGVRIHGIWNTEWEQSAAFGLDEIRHTKASFVQLCDVWNDLDDGRRDQVLDIRDLQFDLYSHLQDFGRRLAGQPAHGALFEQAIIEADRLYHMWRCAEEGVDFNSTYEPIDAQDISTGFDKQKRPVIMVTAPRTSQRISRLELSKATGSWQPTENLQNVTGSSIIL
ncbi:hypothetical protein [Asticcacaulis sp. W401b]|uniref:hypothetical protein n=1 Tax=Asticcacaulis sp. W401b TaxID=3388666 RepID=UPI0039708262